MSTHSFFVAWIDQAKARIGAQMGWKSTSPARELGKLV
jgi:hypothetical protein